MRHYYNGLVERCGGMREAWGSSMIEFVTLNGVAVRVSALERRRVARPDGTEGEEVRLVVVLPGPVAHHWFRSLLEEEPVRFAIPGEAERAMTVVASTWTTGAGEPKVFRHEATLREAEGPIGGAAEG